MSRASDLPTIDEVAQQAGVSPATVSRVLNGRGDVAEETRTRVQQAIDQMGYGRKQREKEAVRYIALVSISLGGMYQTEIMRGAIAQMQRANYQAVIYQPEKEPTSERDYLAIAQRTGGSGMLVIDPHLRDYNFALAGDAHIPFVWIDHHPDTLTVPCVRSTNWQGGYDATKHLIDLGHRRIACLTGWHARKSEAREHGYRSALADATILFDPTLIYEANYSHQAAYKRASELLSRPDRPTAIFACSDYMAMGVIAAAYAAGLRVPDDLSVVGFDDLIPDQFVHPPLTTIKQPLQQMGRVAAQMVIDMLNGVELVSRQLELPTELIVRGSTAAP